LSAEWSIQCQYTSLCRNSAKSQKAKLNLPEKWLIRLDQKRESIRFLG
jgi:hypothetical protein